MPRKDRPPLPTPTEYLCLVRASLRNRKISTVVRIFRLLDNNRIIVCTILRHDFHLPDPFQGCKQIPAGILESPEDERKRAEEAEEVEVGEAEGSLTQRGLTAWQLFISLLLKLSLLCSSRIYRHLYKPTMGRHVLCSIFV